MSHHPTFAASAPRRNAAPPLRRSGERHVGGHEGDVGATGSGSGVATAATVVAASAGAREAGKFRLEGKDYVVQEGDVMQIRFAV